VVAIRYRIKWATLLIVLVISGGTLGYHVAGMGWLDSLYQTVVTVTTVGYTDLAGELGVKPFTIILVGVGALTTAVVISMITATIVEAQLREIIGRRRVEGKVRKLRDHVVLCGFGRFGRTIAAELQRTETQFVVVEADPGKAEAAREHGCLAIEADATEEESLLRAGMEACRGVLTTLGSDADNVYVTLTAKQKNRSIKVVSIAQDERAASKLHAAGADEVVTPYHMGGTWMAQVLISPAVADFMKMATGANPLDFYMDEQVVTARSSLCGQRLRDTSIRSELGVIVVAVRRVAGELLTNPPSDLRIGAGDVLVSLGGQEQLATLKKIAAGD
jgi:voltage-gated potassium channel